MLLLTKSTLMNKFSDIVLQTTFAVLNFLNFPFLIFIEYIEVTG